MLTLEPVVIDFEGFCDRKSNYKDTISLQPANPLKTMS